MMSRNRLTGALGRGELVRVLPDLYSLAMHTDSRQVRARAASRWAPAGSAVTGRAALVEWGVLGEGAEEVGLVVPRGCHRSVVPWLHVTSQTVPCERFDAGAGLTLVGPADALIHAFAREPHRTRADLVYRACANGVSAERAIAHLDRLPRARGRRALLGMLGLAAKGVESYLEERAVTRVFTGDAFASVILQHRVRVAGQSFRIDAFHAKSGTAFEVDGDGSHSDAAAQRRDRRRDALLATRGVLTVRFSFVDVMNRPDWCRAVALDVLKRRST
ncbi:hypothetical protein [Demequina aestuarii]|uniref:hypothetical protein n=1 Tax=Demequina aestuarii TaxID=327095 RepID=UPI00128B1E94|nr:hypothetical protein [Demequina aestuarii]